MATSEITVNVQFHFHPWFRAILYGKHTKWLGALLVYCFGVDPFGRFLVDGKPFRRRPVGVGQKSG